MTPSRKNVLRIKKEIPLKHIKLTAAFKSRGGLEDMFYIQNVEVCAKASTHRRRLAPRPWAPRVRGDRAVPPPRRTRQAAATATVDARRRWEGGE